MLFCRVLHMAASPGDSAAARFLFNYESSADGVNGTPALMKNVLFDPDRFGNKKCAAYVLGNIESYLKIGPGAINPEAGTISLWFCMHGWLSTGKGVDSSPLFSIKAHNGDNCTDAIYIGVDLNTKRLNGSTCNSCEEAVTVYSTDSVRLTQWHHAALTYDDTHLTLYFDGQEQYRAPRGFRTRLLEGDSVVLGMRTSPKNERYFLGSIDDLMIFDRVLDKSEIAALYHAPDHNKRNILIKWTLILLAAAGAVFLIVIAVKRRISVLVEREKQKDILRKRWLELENKVLSAQMDPHFVFNSLNTLQQMILASENDKAQHYLAQFAKLIRTILETNTRDSVTLQEETDICEKYLEIEALRFNQVFTYRIEIDPAIDPLTTRIPHFFVQPIIENAIWHGLLPKEGPKQLTISFRLSDNAMLCVVDDNGIGRRASTAQQKRKKNSLALQFIEQRLQLFSKLKKGYYYVRVNDKTTANGESLGTRVEIRLPLIKNEQYETSDHY